MSYCELLYVGTSLPLCVCVCVCEVWGCILQWSVCALSVYAQEGPREMDLGGGERGRESVCNVLW